MTTHLITDLTQLDSQRPVILTIGAFDGVHRGHQYLIEQVVQRARALGMSAVVLTFDPRPLVVLRPGSTQLTDGAEKARLISELHPDELVVLPFTHALASMTATAFLGAITERLTLSEIWVGADFAFGHNREGNVQFLIEAAKQDGFAVHIVARWQLDGVPVSSTQIRELVAEGDVAGAEALLGHYLTVPGRVVAGFGRGKGLGFPTANIRPHAAQMLPGTGIYAGFLVWDGISRASAISVGYNPVFGGESISLEAHVLDFEGDLRDWEVRVEFVERLRPEDNFESVGALIEQMAIDVRRAREILLPLRPA